jgi:crotonobetaine/carnitine-CoA ligase
VNPTPDFLSGLPLSEQVAAHILRRQAQRIGTRVFTICGDETVTYADADRRADRMAAALQSIGIGKGQRVALLLHNSLTYLDLWFGLTRIGAIQLPLNTAYKSLQLLHTLKRAPVSAVVVDDDLLPELETVIDQVSAIGMVIVTGSTKPRCKCKYLLLNDIFNLAAVTPKAVAVSGADTGAIMNTSGTTGPSKGVLLPHAQQYILGRNIARDLQLSQDDVYYNFFPLFHNTAQAMITLPVLLAGGSMVLIDRFSATRFWSDVRAHGVTAFYYIGEILRILLKSTRAADGQGTRLRIGWGIGASPRDFVEFQARHGVTLRTGYGSTEANVPIFSPPQHTNADSVGRVIAGFEVRVADAHCDPLPPGQTGEILVRSSDPCAVMQGYDGDPKATVEAWKDLWFHTGDAGYFDAAGDLYFVGRVRDAIRVRGENVSAFEIEEVVAQVDGVVEVAAIAVPCDLGGDDVKIAVVARDGAGVTPQKLIAHTQQHLPRFAVPRYVELVAALPKTETNKVRKNVLRESPFTPDTWDRLSQQAQQQQQ